MRFKEFYLTETPVAYDDETRSKVGFHDEESNTIWGHAPDKNAKVAEVEQWVSESIRKGILKSEGNHLGTGASRTCLYNNGKTAFKFNHNISRYGNQTAKEVSFYKKYGSKFSDVLVKILDYGKNWQIVEYAKPYTPGKFLDSTGCAYWQFSDFCNDIDQDEMLDMYKANKKNVSQAIKGVAKGKREASYLQVARSPILCRMIEFCLVSGSQYSDLHSGNIGFRGTDPIIIDFGLSKENS